ncbi:Geraniol 8-hydroxylase [Capsicum baccatum]|uniref:Geraniol 8-hydroxylase n=1 Tax=Capsicum baccatum TaxID=33114 RepID=A0A2G2WB51_CAPBA|nr:Geraniol 8-hydroxylase [Capsicum baccatum]
MAKQVLKYQDQDFSTRFIVDAVRAHNYWKSSVAWLPVCPQWRTLRRILNTNIFSSNMLDANQHLRSQKMKELIAYCAKCCQKGEALDVGQIAFKTNLNLLSNTLFSKDLADPFSDSKVELKDVIWDIMSEMGKPNLVDFFPILEKIDPQGIRHRTSIHFDKLFKLFDDLINERKKEKRRLCGERSDFLEVYLNDVKENPEELNHNHIKALLLDLFLAGTDTTTSTLEWAMTEILRQPKILKKAKDELAEIIGKEKLVEEADVSRLPYLQCIIKEVLRMHPPAPFLGPRKVEQDVELRGYIIPKGSQVIGNKQLRDGNGSSSVQTSVKERIEEWKNDVAGGSSRISWVNEVDHESNSLNTKDQNTKLSSIWDEFDISQLANVVFKLEYVNPEFFGDKLIGELELDDISFEVEYWKNTVA